MRSTNARLGLLLFAVYLLLYGSYVLVNALQPQWMEWTPWGGVNLAILSGLGLIAAAFVLSLLYGVLCRAEASPAVPAGEEQA
jgi:uncharacterized membrane protein (DUF485 family)